VIPDAGHEDEEYTWGNSDTAETPETPLLAERNSDKGKKLTLDM